MKQAPLTPATLSPTEFENLTYDLLFLSGLKNLRWRTPGADSGRDLEGEIAVLDFTGHTSWQRWYVECKRYKASIAWPTVFEKLAIAENHRADYLLFVTTSNFSPDCRDEVERHNSKGRVQIRIWPGHRIAHLLELYPQVAAKYGLSKSGAPTAAQFSSIVSEITKIAQAAYSAASFGADTLPYIELLAALMELLAARDTDLRAHGKFTASRFKAGRDEYDWCKPPLTDCAEFDGPSLRAALCAVRVLTGSDTLKCTVKPNELIESELSDSQIQALHASRLLDLVTSFGFLGMRLTDDSVVIEKRSP